MTELKRVYEWNQLAGTDQHDKYHPLFDLPTCPAIKAQYEFIQEEFNELQDAINENNYTETLDALGDILVTVAGMCYRLGVDPEEVLKRVNDSNFSKFLPPKEKGVIDKEYELLAYRTITKYKDDPRYSNVEIDAETGVATGITKEGNKKVLKAITFVEPDFSDLI
jgi:hypothetical protein